MRSWQAAAVGRFEPNGLLGMIGRYLDMNAISSWEEVPLFDRDEAEAAFWSVNRPDLRLMELSVARATDSAESVTITLRIDPRMLARIKRLARSIIGYAPVPGFHLD